VCTGSGNLALAIAWHEARARVHGADLSADAVALARRNAEHLGLGGRVTFASGDLLAPFDTPEFRGRVDLLVCNPPYISSGKVDALPAEIGGHEPRLAFDGGPFGIRILHRLVNDAARLLRQGGTLAFEVGLGQGPGMRRRLEQGGRYTGVEEIADAQGSARVLLARLA
jgi:release factor glutamine methyltransferase